MKRFLISFLLSAILAVGLFLNETHSQTVKAQQPGELIPDSYIVVFKDNVSNPDLAIADTSKNLGINVKHHYTHKVKGYSAVIPPEKLAQVKADPRVLMVTQDRVIRITASKTNPSVRPAGTQTITFDDLTSLNRPLNGQYPVGVIDWGNNNWFLSSPWGKFRTNSISFNGWTNSTPASFTFVSPRRLVQLDAYNGGFTTATTTISCSGQPNVSVNIPVDTIITIQTNWSGTCNSVTMSSTNGWDTNYDNLVIETTSPSPTSTPVPTPTPTPVPTANPTSTPLPTPTPGPTQTIDFNDLSSPNRNLNGQYPTGVVNWGNSAWYLSAPWGKFTTNSISFRNGTISQANFDFISPRTLTAVDAYNGGNSNSTTTLTCSGNPNVVVNIPAGTVITIQTAWVSPCSSVNIASSNNWYTNYDNLVITNGQSPTPTPVPTPTATPTPAPTLTPTPVPSTQITPTGVSRIGLNPLNQGNGIVVAVIDTGIDTSHPDLAGEVIASHNCVDPSQPATDGNGHGTHVAGTIAAQNNNFGVVGVAPGVKLVNVKVFDDSGAGTWSTVICGVDWVSANSSSLNIKVANMSLGGGGSSDNNCGLTNSDALHNSICNSTQAGITYVVAAGNDGVNTSGFVPAAYDDTVITVSALADSDGKSGGQGSSTWAGADDTFASFSNYGSAVALGAPGVDIYSTYKGGIYVTLSGTSMAAPHVSASVALYLATHPGSTWSQVRDGLRAVAEPLGSGHTDPSGRHPEPVVRASGL